MAVPRAVTPAGPLVAGGRTAPHGPLRRAALAAWQVLTLGGLLTSVRFAVLQIVLVACGAVIGIVLPQLPGVALRSAADYAERIAILRARVEPALGTAVTDIFERLGFFRVFSAPWFSALLVLLAVSIVVCTLDRTPGLWRQVGDVRVVQPDAFYDPALPGRAAIAGGLAQADVRAALRRARFGVRQDAAGPVTYLYGDRNRYAKLATLLMHAGLVGFLVAAAITSAFGIETGLLLPVGQAIPVGSIGTEGLVSVKNVAFEAPRDPSGRFTDFTTDLAVYQDGREIARKVIRVNDPLAAAGFTFHQNFFGPAVDMTIRDRSGGLLWGGPVPLDQSFDGMPSGQLVVPGRDVILQLVLYGSDRPNPLFVVAVRPSGTNADGSTAYTTLFAGFAGPGSVAADPAVDFTTRVDDFGAYSGVIVKRDPGAQVVWLSFLCLIVGLTITFYLPRRRVWARLDQATGELRLVGRADRYVSWDREFGRLLGDLVARRASGSPASESVPPAVPPAAPG
jgi:cytochrome c biogenesis protein